MESDSDSSNDYPHDNRSEARVYDGNDSAVDESGTDTDIGHNDDGNLEEMQSSSDDEASDISFELEPELEPRRGRKRKPNPKMWYRNRVKSRKVQGQSHYSHNKQRIIRRKERQEVWCRCNCSNKFTEAEKEWVFSSFWTLANHELQNSRLQGMIEDTGSSTLSNGQIRRGHAYKIHLEGRSETVCKKFFVGIHGIKACRLKHKILKKGVDIRDGRGKHGKQRTVGEEKLSGAREFIAEIPKRKSHYSQRQNFQVEYLDAKWNCNRLYMEYLRQYQHRPEGHVKLHKFREIFNYEFNIKFGYPRSDSTCDSYTIKILNEGKKQQPNRRRLDRLEQELKAHQDKAQEFYDTMRAAKLLPEDHLCICMDYGSNLPLPVTNIGDEYYCSQLWIYNLGIHNLKSGDAHMFLYAEHYASKGNDEVLSAFNYYIENVVNEDVRHINLFVDNCSAHNKNSILYAGFQAIVNSRFESLTVNYAIRGHSRMPADADFGKIVVRCRRHETIYGPSTYVKLIQECNNKNPFRIVFLEKPCTDTMDPGQIDVVRVKDYKEAMTVLLNTRVHGIKKIRRIVFRPNVNPEILDAIEDDMIGSEFVVLDDGVSPGRLNRKFNQAKNKYRRCNDIAEEKLLNVERLLKNTDLTDSKEFYRSIPGIRLPSLRRL